VRLTRKEGWTRKVNTNYLSERKASAYLNVSRPTLRKYRRQGILNAVDMGYVVLFTKAELDRFSAAYEVRQGKPISRK
jgi:excisionase family DNA binding protein